MLKIIYAIHHVLLDIINTPPSSVVSLVQVLVYLAILLQRTVRFVRIILGSYILTMTINVCKSVQMVTMEMNSIIYAKFVSKVVNCAQVPLIVYVQNAKILLQIPFHII